MDIINFTLLEYMNQPPEVIESYLIALRYLKPKETEIELIQMKFEDVEFIKQEIDSTGDKALIEIIAKVQNCTEKKVLDFKILDFFGFLNSVREQLKRIYKAEESLIPSDVDFKFEAVNGSERLAKFGVLNTLESLSNGDATKYPYFLNLPYAEVFAIMLMRKEASDIRKEMKEIKTTKND